MWQLAGFRSLESLWLASHETQEHMTESRGLEHGWRDEWDHPILRATEGIALDVAGVWEEGIVSTGKRRMTSLIGMPNLRVFGCVDSWIGPFFMDRLPNLIKLDLTRTNVAMTLQYPNMMPWQDFLGNMPRMRSLSLANSQISDEFLFVIADKMPLLERLDVSSCLVSDEGIEMRPENPKISFSYPHEFHLVRLFSNYLCTINRLLSLSLRS